MFGYRLHNLFVIADEHYYHNNILTIAKRPFATMDEMVEKMVALHNSAVPRGACVYHLGDMFWRKTTYEQAFAIMDALNGTHYLVWGNHDDIIEKNPMLQKRFVWCRDFGIIEKSLPEHPRIILCHYGMRVWRGSHRGDWHLYGHSHGTLPPLGKSFDVGVDNTKLYRPIAIDEIAEVMKLRPQHHRVSTDGSEVTDEQKTNATPPTRR
jgi:calcineurin-like phosphoesterase family protein